MSLTKYKWDRCWPPKLDGYASKPDPDGYVVGVLPQNGDEPVGEEWEVSNLLSFDHADNLFNAYRLSRLYAGVVVAAVYRPTAVIVVKRYATDSAVRFEDDGMYLWRFGDFTHKAWNAKHPEELKPTPPAAPDTVSDPAHPDRVADDGGPVPDVALPADPVPDVVLDHLYEGKAAFKSDGEHSDSGSGE